MPPLISPRRTRQSEEWVVVAEYMVDTDADICVATLKGNRIPAVRFPVMNAGALGYGAVMLEPIRVLVPPGKVAEARELLAEGN
jgi:hypothetical protein